MADVETPALPKKLARGLPAYPVPVALIGRLATDERVRGQGYGARLLRDALTRIVLASQQIACFGVVVDAKDGSAVGFYEKFGFGSLADNGYPRRMFIALKTVLKSIGK
jgi:ribosomal protein S18 acetylase RimI-like enzyme